jgi:YD repeat-containing protein
MKPRGSPRSGHGPPGTPLGNGLGEEPFYTYVSQQLDDRLQVRVNVGNGNLVAHAHDLRIRGTGLDLDIERFYNGQLSTGRDLGTGWRPGTGDDVHLAFANGNVDFYAPGFYEAVFTPNGSGGYNDAPGLDATLVYTNSGNVAYTLTFHETGEQLQFDANGNILADKDRNGNTISFTNNSVPRTTAITDTRGRVTSLSYDSSNRVTSITDATGAKTSFSYSSGSTVVTDANAHATTYTFETSTLLVSKVTDAAGHSRSTPRTPPTTT